MLSPDGQLRDPRVTPRPGDRFRCRSGNEIEVTGVVISVTKEGKETKCLQVIHFYADYMTDKVCPKASVKHQIKQAEILVRGSDLDPWANAERKTASQLFDV
jgi:hypothetical protein